MGNTVKLHKLHILRHLRSGADTNCKKEKPENYVVSFHFFGSIVQLVVYVSAFVMVSIQIGQFLVCCSSTHCAPVPWSRRRRIYGEDMLNRVV